MSVHRLLRQALTSGLLLAACVGLWATLLRQGLEAITRQDAKRLEQVLEPPLQKAHLAKDGIALQESIQSFAHASGISFGCVLDQDERILAHSRLSQLGKVYRPPNRAADLWTFALRDASTRWGTLIFQASSRAPRTLWRHQVFCGIVSSAILWIIFIVWSWTVERRRAQDAALLAEREVLLQESKAESQRLAERLSGAQEASRSWAQRAVEESPRGLLLLDQHQRVAAINQPAMGRLGENDRVALIGKSWHELAELRPSGPALDQSLAFPAKPIDWFSQEPALHLRFETHPDLIRGTWILFD